jgi:hypothetical protein
MADDITKHLNNANYILRHLSKKPNDPLGFLAEAPAFLFTVFKRWGISGWTQTGCSASGYGKPVRDAQWSTDRFYTIDVQLLTLAVASRNETVMMDWTGTTEPRYIRLEVEPGTRAHDVCVNKRPTSNDTIVFKGVVLIDRDGPFYEIHPSELWFYTPGLTRAK